MSVIEACVESLEESIYAEQHGATHLELCAHLELDGLSPSKELVQSVLNNVNIPVKVMVRPRGGNFCYAPEEINQMVHSIKMYKELGVYGVVLGCLNKDSNIDREATSYLASLAKPLHVTFHKAIDATPNLPSNFKILIGIKEIDTVLTSGGQAKALEGFEMINKLYELSEGRIEILAAGKITSENLITHQKKLLTDAFHGRRIV